MRWQPWGETLLEDLRIVGVASAATIRVYVPLLPVSQPGVAHCRYL